MLENLGGRRWILLAQNLVLRALNRFRSSNQAIVRMLHVPHGDVGHGQVDAHLEAWSVDHQPNAAVDNELLRSCESQPLPGLWDLQAGQPHMTRAVIIVACSVNPSSGTTRRFFWLLRHNRLFAAFSHNPANDQSGE